MEVEGGEERVEGYAGITRGEQNLYFLSFSQAYLISIIYHLFPRNVYRKSKSKKWQPILIAEPKPTADMKKELILPRKILKAW